jgi:hypothetical protein
LAEEGRPEGEADRLAEEPDDDDDEENERFGEGSRLAYRERRTNVKKERRGQSKTQTLEVDFSVPARIAKHKS